MDGVFACDNVGNGRSCGSGLFRRFRRGLGSRHVAEKCDSRLARSRALNGLSDLHYSFYNNLDVGLA